MYFKMKQAFTLTFFFVNCIAGGGGQFAGTDRRVLPHAPHVPTLGPNICWPITEQAGVAMTLQTFIWECLANLRVIMVLLSPSRQMLR